MQNLLQKLCLLLALSVTVFSSGCSKEAAAPTPILVGELPAAMNKAFTSAKPELKETASQVSSAVQSQDYTRAFAGLQSLMNADLSKDQAEITARSLLTVNSLMQSAEAQGNQQAAEALRVYRQNK